MLNETMQLLKDADQELHRAYMNVRIAISDLKDDKEEQMPLQAILVTIDKAKQELEKILEADSSEPWNSNPTKIKIVSVKRF